MKIVWIAVYEDNFPVRITWHTWRKHDPKRGRGGNERIVGRVLSFVHAGHDSAEIEGNDTNDLKLQSRDSDAQSDCSEMVAFASLLSLEVVLQT